MTIAGRYETQEIVFRTEPAAAAAATTNASSATAAVNGAGGGGGNSVSPLTGQPVVSTTTSSPTSVTELLAQVASTGAGVSNGLVTPSQGSATCASVVPLPTDVNVGNQNTNFQQPVAAAIVSSSNSSTGAFRSPNVVAPGSQPIPYLQQHQRPVLGGGPNAVVQSNAGQLNINPNAAIGHHPSSGIASGGGVVVAARAQPVYAGPYPFASMTHAAQSMLGQTGQPSSSFSSSSTSSSTSTFSSSTSSSSCAPAITTMSQTIPRTGRPLTTMTSANNTINHPAVTSGPPPSTASSSSSSSPSPLQVMSSALHPVTIKSAETFAAAAAVVFSSPTTMQVGGINALNSSAQQIQSNPQQQQQPFPNSSINNSTSSPTPNPTVVRSTTVAVNQQMPSSVPSGSSNVNFQSVPITTVSSPLLVNLLQQQQQQLQQQQQQQQQQQPRNNMSNRSGSPGTVGIANTSVTSSDSVMESNSVDALEKVRQQKQLQQVTGGGSRPVSRTHNSPLSSSPAASPYHVSSPNSPAGATTVVVTANSTAVNASASVETNLTLAASVTVLNVRTGAPLNTHTALSSLTPTIAPPTNPSAVVVPVVVPVSLPSSSSPLETGEALQVCLSLLVFSFLHLF